MCTVVVVLLLYSHSTNSLGDDQLFPAVGTGWLSVPLCVQHVLFNPIVYHKVLAVSLGNPPLLLLGVSQFLRALLFSAGPRGDEIFNPAESLQEKSAFNYCSLLRAEVKEQVEMVHGTRLSSFRAAEKLVMRLCVWVLSQNNDVNYDVAFKLYVKLYLLWIILQYSSGVSNRQCVLI